MTNKSMIIVPRELLERAVKAGVAKVNAIDLCDAWRAVAELKDILSATPAEDVRAVGNEPVYQVRSHGSCCWEDVSGESLELCRCQPEHYEIRELYRRPQCSEVSQQCSEHLRIQGRQVVMPERYDESQYRGTSLLAVRRWNACLDEIARLNK